MEYKKDIPQFEAKVYASSQHRYAVFIFFFNEGPKLASQLAKFPESNRCYDILMGDDGSNDSCLTEGMIHQHGIRARIRLLRNMGLSANIKAGLHWLLEDGSYDGVIMMNGNDKDDVVAIPEFITKLDQGYDYIQGSRFLPGGEAANTPLVRYWAIRLVHAPLFSLAARRWMSDTTNGYRAFSTRFLRDQRMRIFQEAFQKYEVEQYLAWKALRLGFKSCEIPVARRYPPQTQRTGSSFTKIKPGIGYWHMIKPLLMINLNLYR